MGGVPPGTTGPGSNPSTAQTGARTVHRHTPSTHARTVLTHTVSTRSHTSDDWSWGSIMDLRNSEKILPETTRIPSARAWGQDTPEGICRAAQLPCRPPRWPVLSGRHSAGSPSHHPLVALTWARRRRSGKQPRGLHSEPGALGPRAKKGPPRSVRSTFQRQARSSHSSPPPVNPLFQYVTSPVPTHPMNPQLPRGPWQHRHPEEGLRVRDVKMSEEQGAQTPAAS